MKHLRAQSYGILSPFFVPFLPQNQHCPISSVQDNSGIKSCQIMLRFLSSAIQMGFFSPKNSKDFNQLQPPVFSSHQLLSCSDRCKLHSDHRDHGNCGVVMDGDLPVATWLFRLGMGRGPNYRVYIYI